MEKRISSLTILLICVLVWTSQSCVHDQISVNHTFHYYNDLSEEGKLKQGRLLQNLVTSMTGSLRIFNDYSFLKTGNQTQINVIKRVMNISANYFYNIITVPRLDKLVYPSDSPGQCGILSIPFNYMTTGVIADLGILVTNEVNAAQSYVAKSIACVLLKSNNRPIWGFMSWNNPYLEYNQVGFQKIVYVAIHQIIHILGYSASLYNKYPSGNPYRNASDGTQYLTSPIINAEITDYFGCSTLGIILEDQDGTLISSHNQRKVFGNQALTASAKKGAYMSRATMALLASTGWYTVSYDYAEPSIWGKKKGCQFLNVNNCAFPQFCPTQNSFFCDWDVTAYGNCSVDPFTGACKVPRLFTNTVCIDENYQVLNVNAFMEAQERGGYTSKCFSSNYRKIGVAANQLNNRCYVSVCSVSKAYLYILIGSSILYCSTNNYGIDIPAPPDLEGTLKCPSSFSNYCDIKKTCAYNCNKNGACINGMCLCTGSTVLTQTCIDTSLAVTQMDTTGGLTAAIKSIGDMLFLVNSKNNNRHNSRKYQQIIKSITQVPGIMASQLTEYRINTRCIVGTFYQKLFGECVLCMPTFQCQKCNEQGCLTCDGGVPPNNQGKCAKVKRL